MITIVSGLPRSGTSLMMQILSAGGMEILTDNLRPPDVNNPKGYFEFERTKSLAKDNSWLEQAENKAVKVIAQLVKFLPTDHSYKCIVMDRNIDEILLSQSRMITALGGNQSTVTNEILKKTFMEQLSKVKHFLAANQQFNMYVVNYNELLSGREAAISRLNEALSLGLDVDEAASVIDDSLYRNRGGR